MTRALLLFTILSGSAQAYGQSLVEKYHEIRRDIVKDEEQKRQVLSELYKVNRSMRRVADRKENLTQEKMLLSKRIKESAGLLQELEARLHQERNLVVDRLRVLYKFEGQGAVRFLFSSQSFADLDKNLKVLKILTDRDYQIMKNYQKNLQDLKLQRSRFNHDVKRLTRLKKQIEDQEAQLVARQAQKSKILEKLDQSTLHRLENLEKIRNESSLSSVATIRAAFFEKKGKLSAPVQGQLVQRFGQVQSKLENVMTRAKGHYYSAPVGSAVLSIHPGEVVAAQNVHGFGGVVVISHADHYYSVYGGLSRWTVNVGASVGKDQIIGIVGNRYYMYGSGLYFEVRHFSEPLDPSDWLIQQDQKISQIDSTGPRRKEKL